MDGRVLCQYPACPFSDFIVSPNQNVGTIPGLRHNWKIVGDVLGRFNCDLDTEILLELVRDYSQTLGSGAIHPDQKLAIRPSE